MEHTQREKVTLSEVLACSKAQILYERLGLTSRASEGEVIRNGKRMLALLHPDRHMQQPDDARRTYTEAFKRVSEAYEILRDSSRRAQYDGGSAATSTSDPKNQRAKAQAEGPRQTADRTWDDLKFRGPPSNVAWAKRFFLAQGIAPDSVGPMLAARRLFEHEAGVWGSSIQYVQLVKASEILGCATREDFGRDAALTERIMTVARKMWASPGMRTIALYPDFLARIQETHDSMVIHDSIKGTALEYGVNLWRSVGFLIGGGHPLLTGQFASLMGCLEMVGGPTHVDFARQPEIQYHIQRLAGGIAKSSRIEQFRRSGERNFINLCVDLGLSTPKGMQSYFEISRS